MSTQETAVASDHRGRRKPPGFFKRLVAWGRRRTGMTGYSTGSMFVPPLSPGSAATVAAIDFSAWLQHTVHPEDHVVLHVDIAGAEFEVRGSEIQNSVPTLVAQSYDM